MKEHYQQLEKSANSIKRKTEELEQSKNSVMQLEHDLQHRTDELQTAKKKIAALETELKALKHASVPKSQPNVGENVTEMDKEEIPTYHSEHLQKKNLIRIIKIKL
jgi:CII-binding regulator of phage lambda lysogenization HflD